MLIYMYENYGNSEGRFGGKGTAANPDNGKDRSDTRGLESPDRKGFSQKAGRVGGISLQT